MQDCDCVEVNAEVEGTPHMFVIGLFITHTGCGFKRAHILSTIVISISIIQGSRVILKLN